MFRFSDTAVGPWWVVHADDQKAVRLTVIAHLLSVPPYEHPSLAPIDLPQR